MKPGCLEGHRMVFRFHSECNGKSLESLELRGDVLFLPLKDHSLRCSKTTVGTGVEEARRPFGRLV